MGALKWGRARVTLRLFVVLRGNPLSLLPAALDGLWIAASKLVSEGRAGVAGISARADAGAQKGALTASQFLHASLR